MKKLFLIVALALEGCQASPRVQRRSAPPALPLAVKAAPMASLPKVSAAKFSHDLSFEHGPLKIVFSREHRSQRYSKYTLTAQNLRDRYIKRDRDVFSPDPFLADADIRLALKPSVYSRSGYDRGHLVPAEDLTWSAEGYFATFYLSNMSPQAPRLNQKAWKELEEWARDAACGEEKVTVITGPLLEKGLPWLKGDRASTVVPHRYFKLVVDETPPRKAVAFLYSQDDAAKGFLREHLVPLTEVQAQTGIDFSSELMEAQTLFASSRTSLEGWKLLSERKFCPQKKVQVLSSELRKQRAEPRIPAGKK